MTTDNSMCAARLNWRKLLLAWVVACLGFPVGPQPAFADHNPSGCVASTPGLVLVPFLDSTATAPIAGQNVFPGQTIYYEVILFQGAFDCGFEGGAILITTPDGVTTNITADQAVPLICDSPGCNPFGTSVYFSKLVPYTVRAQDVGVNQAAIRPCAVSGVQCTARYTGGVSHCGESDDCIVSALSSTCNPIANNWVNTNGGKWEAATNWSLGVVPNNSQRVSIANLVDKVVSIDSTTAGSFPQTLTVASLKLDAPEGSTNLLLMAGSGTNVPLTVRESMLVSGSGGLVLNGASLRLAAPSFPPCKRPYIFNGRVSVQTGSSAEIETDLLVGGPPPVGSLGGSAGALEIEGGAVTISGGMIIGEFSGATGTVVVTGGELVATNASLVIGASGGMGNLMMISPAGNVLRPIRESHRPQPLAGGGGSVLRAQTIIVADDGSTGALVVDDGTAFVAEDVVVGNGPTATGVLAVGTSLLVGENFKLNNNSTLEFRITGYNTNDTEGRIDVGGTASFAGELAVRLSDDFGKSITNGTSILALTAGTITGAFANVANGARLTTEGGEGSFRVDYDGTDLVLEDFKKVESPFQDLAVVGIKAPKTVRLKTGRPPPSKRVKVQIQNRSGQAAQIDSLTGLVTLVAESINGDCPDAQVTLHPGKPNKPLPVVLKPNKKLNVIFDVVFNCANDGDKGIGHEDFRYEATLTGADQDSSNNTCPRSSGGDDAGCVEVTTDVILD